MMITQSSQHVILWQLIHAAALSIRTCSLEAFFDRCRHGDVAVLTSQLGGAHAGSVNQGRVGACSHQMFGHLGIATYGAQVKDAGSVVADAVRVSPVPKQHDRNVEVICLDCQQ
jgi:hypothetical protein